MDYKESHKTKAILLMLGSSLFFAFMTAFVKKSGDLPFMEKALFRNLISLIIAFSALKAKKQPLWGRRENRTFLILRGMVGSLGILLYFYSIDRLIIADASMLNKLSSFFVILFARLLLKNRIRFFQLTSLALALVGSALIIKPGFQFSSTGPAVVCTLSAVAAGLAYTIVSYLGNRENSFTIVFYFSMISTVICLPVLFVNPVMPAPAQALFLLGAGITAAGGQFLLTAAYRCAPAGEVSIYQYSQIVFASLLGIAFFSELPDLYSIIGYVLIFAGGYYIFLKGKRSGKIM